MKDNCIHGYYCKADDSDCLRCEAYFRNIEAKGREQNEKTKNK